MVAYDLSKKQLTTVARQGHTTPRPPAAAWGAWVYFLNETYGYKGSVKEMGGRYSGSCTIRKVEWHGGGPSICRPRIKASPLPKMVVVGTGRQENASVMALLRRGNRTRQTLKQKAWPPHSSRTSYELKEPSSFWKRWRRTQEKSTLLPGGETGKSPLGSWFSQKGISPLMMSSGKEAHPQESVPCLMSLSSFVISLISSWMIETYLQ